MPHALSIVILLARLFNHFLKLQSDNPDNTIVEEANHEHEEEMQDDQDETVLEKTLEMKENEANEERVTCVDDEVKPVAAPLASSEPDEAPLASLESTSEFSSM